MKRGIGIVRGKVMVLSQTVEIPLEIDEVCRTNLDETTKMVAEDMIENHKGVVSDVVISPPFIKTVNGHNYKTCKLTVLTVEDA